MESPGHPAPHIEPRTAEPVAFASEAAVPMHLDPTQDSTTTLVVGASVTETLGVQDEAKPAGTVVSTQHRSESVSAAQSVAVGDIGSSSEIEPALASAALHAAGDHDLVMVETSALQPSPSSVLHPRPVEDSASETREVESVSGSTSSGLGFPPSSTGSLPQVTLTSEHLDFLNAQLETMGPMEILRFSKILFPNLYQASSFGLTGLVTLHMLSKLREEMPASPHVELIFLDTLHHFPETYDLIDRVKQRYPGVTVHVFKPFGVETAEEFAGLYGEKLYETEAEMYDWVAKVEPLQRAYADLNVAAILTGRRRSQGGNRDNIRVIELDDERGVIKINPMITWSFDQVEQYIRENNIPYNALLDRGYKSIGDWHSTSPVSEGEGERDGRWKGQSKSECGIHNKKSRYAKYLEDMARKAGEENLAAASAMEMQTVAVA